MIAHQIFFDVLGDMDDKSAEWNSIFAGLSVLRLADRFLTGGETPVRDSPELDTARSSVAALNMGDPARVILSRILDSLEHTDAASAELGRDLISYGKALDLEARWSLAVDVFDLVTEKFSSREQATVVIEAATAAGAASRNAGDWAASDRNYALAEHLAERIGDRSLYLTARVGMATSHMIRGNLPAAEAELSEVLEEARSRELQDVEAVALHATSSVAHSRGDYARAIHLGFQSLELTTKGSARDRLISDIAAGYAGLAMRDAARDGYTIVMLTSPHQWVRWQASLNLMELAIEEGDEVGYERQLHDLETARFDRRLNGYFLYFKAIGARRFGHGDYERALEEAHAFALENKLNQLAFQIEEAGRRTDARDEIPSTSPSGQLLQIAEVLEHLRHEASV